jgi:hypothetical protein
MGHAVSDKPTGPFKADAKFMKGCGFDAIDPFALVDTGSGGSGKAYLAWNQVGTTPNKVYISELNSNYDDVTGKVHDISSGLGSPTRYKEGVWMVKQNNTWYCIIADWTGAVESISYSTSKRLLGPYKKHHDILNQNTNSATIHPGVVHFLDKWLLFYHTGGNEFGGTINSGTKRVTGIEEIVFDTTKSLWTIPAVPKTFRGVGVPHSYDTIQVDRHSPKGIGNAGIKPVAGKEPRGWMIHNIKNNGFVRYNDVDFSGMDKSSGDIQLRVAGASGGGSIEVRAGGKKGPMFAEVKIPSTGGLTSWKTVSAPISAEGLAVSGVEDLVLVFKTTKPNQYAVNWITVGKEQSTGAGNIRTNPIHKYAPLVRVDGRRFRLYLSNAADLPSIRVFGINGREIFNIKVQQKFGPNEVLINFNEATAQSRYFLSVKTGNQTDYIPIFF